jgi:hypothetical protein
MWTRSVDNPGPRSRLTPGTDFPGPGSRTWRPPAALLIGVLALALLAAAFALLARDPMDRVVAGAGAVVLLAVAGLGWRRRLVGGPRGLLIAGASGARLLPWSAVRGIDCGRTRRLGSATLEIDLVDDELILFGRLDLGADPADVAAELTGWFAART